MTYKEIATMIKEIGVPYAYYQFPDNTGQEPPFICFYYSGDNDEIADNQNYQKIERLVVEVYTRDKDFNLEETAEAAFAGAGLVYTKTEAYIDSERLLEEIYEMDVLITQEV